MKPARLLAFALAVAVLPSGLAAASSACAMGGCEPAMTSEDHDCCPDAVAELYAARCERSRAAPPATQPKPPERRDASHGVVALASVAAGAQRSPPAARARIAAAAFASTFPLDGLAQSCILRI